MNEGILEFNSERKYAREEKKGKQKGFSLLLILENFWLIQLTKFKKIVLITRNSDI
jgi:hypothetical protein